MINKENSNKEIVLMELSMSAMSHDWPNHFNTNAKSASTINQLIAKTNLNLICDKGDEAILKDAY
jgi:hypothetical protein